MEKKIIIVYGPTGVGKTDFALKLANMISAQMINLDIGQFYSPLSIGTAKPDLGSIHFPYHFFNILDKPINYTALDYSTELFKKLPTIWGQNSYPLLVGGAGFYLKSIFFPPLAQKVIYQGKFINGNWELLHKIDPERARQINPNDTYRISRALDIWYSTGKKPSTIQPEFRLPSSFLLIHLFRERDDLYKKINERVVKMFDDGLWAEAEKLMGTEWQNFVKEKKIIGYDEIINALEKNNNIDKEEVIRTIQKRTRNYAKQQETFWRMLEKNIREGLKQSVNTSQSFIAEIESINLTFTDVDLYIEQLVKSVFFK